MVTRALATVAVLGLAGCGGGPDDARRPTQRLLRTPTPAPALAATAGGGLLVGARDGTVTQVGAAPRHPFPQLRVSGAGQRGLLGLATLGVRVFATYTTPRGRIVVAELHPGAAPTRVWTGPVSATLANGGHLAATPDGSRLVIGIGDLQARPRGGRLLSLDPDGPPDQRPVVLSSGWNNPFALTFLGRELWVADNSPGRAPERLARGDRGLPRDVTALPVKTAPSGLARVDDHTLAVCGFISHTLDRYVRDGRAWRRAGVIAPTCRYGVVALGDGRLAYATDTTIQEVTP